LSLRGDPGPTTWGSDPVGALVLFGPPRRK